MCVKSIIRYLGVLLSVLCFQALYSQSVELSPDIIMRSNANYDLVGNLGDAMTLIEDDGKKLILHRFDRTMARSNTVEIYPRTRRGTVRGYVPLDTQLVVCFTEQDSGWTEISMDQFDDSGNLRSQYAVARFDRTQFQLLPLIISEDRTKQLIRIRENNKTLTFYLYDLVTNKVLWTHQITERMEIPVEADRVSNVLSNEGVYIAVYENERIFRHTSYKLMCLNNSGLLFKDYAPENHQMSDLEVYCNNQTGHYFLMAIYGNASANVQEGILRSDLDIHTLEIGDPLKINFLPKTIDDFFGKDVTSKSGLNDLELKDVVFRWDGGMLIFCEQKKEISRINNVARSSFMTMNSSVDYYIEDVLITSFSPKGTMEWQKVLQKKQHSYDDRAVFSSYFIHENPSALRLIFNDEIRAENTISEYIINPKGKVERRVLFNTAESNLHLQIRNAVQVSAVSSVMPSVSKSKLRLVKITY